MRQLFTVLEFCLILLVLAAGCASAPPVPCNLPSADPIRFQKFLPDVPGYEREFGQNISPGNNYRMDFPGGINGIEDHYAIPGHQKQSNVTVSLYDLGPCVTESTGVFSRLDKYPFGIYLDTTESRVSFHGYPAIHVVDFALGSGYIRSDSYRIGVTDRLYIVISRSDSPENRVLLPEAEADIEKFADAIDFEGFAASV